MASETQQDSLRELQQFPSSPSWSHNTKLFVSGWIAIFAVGVLLFFNQIIILILLALVISLMIRPFVDFVNLRLPRVPRWLVTAFFYLLLLGGLFAIPISAVPSLWQQVISFISSLPNLLQQLIDQLTLTFSEPVYIFGTAYTFPINEIAIATYQDYLGEVVALGANSVSSVGSLAGDFATGALLFFSRVVFVLFVSFYLTKDEGVVSNMVLNNTPVGYRADIEYLMNRVGLIWGAFLRGQVILMLAMGSVTFVAASILGLPNPVALAVIAGVMELVPFIGPILAAIPAALIAFFQSDASWLGQLLTPFWFFVVVMSVYWVLQQIENYFVLPRVMGHQLKLHPAVVFVAAIAGFQLSGLVGVFVAAPLIATLRILFRFVFGKLLDVSEPIQSPVSAEPATPPTEPASLPAPQLQFAKHNSAETTPTHVKPSDVQSV